MKLNQPSMIDRIRYAVKTQWQISGQMPETVALSQEGYKQLLSEIEALNIKDGNSAKSDVDHFDGMRIIITGAYRGECMH